MNKKNLQLLPLRFWHFGRNRMYDVRSWIGYEQVECQYIDQMGEVKLVTFHIDEGDLMHFIWRRDYEGHDIYEKELIKNRESGVVCVVGKLMDELTQKEGIRCLIDDIECLHHLPYTLEGWDKIGDIYTTPWFNPIRKS